jgi:hypothetical protein
MATNLVQSKLTSVVKPAPSKAAPTKATTAKEPVAAVELSESSDDSDDPPRVKG